MNLCNDVYKIVLKNTDKTTLLVCKWVCKQFSSWVKEINPKLSWSIVHIVKNDYYHLYANWIVPTIGAWQREWNHDVNVDYYIGKGCSYAFLKSFEDISIQDVMWGAMASGNVGYIKHLCGNYKLIKYETVLTYFSAVLASRSIESIKYLISKFIKLKNLVQVDYSLVDLRDNSKGDNPLKFIEYMLKTFPKSNKQDLLMNVSANNAKLVESLIKLHCKFNIGCLLAAVRKNNLDSIKLIDDNFQIDKSEPIKVKSVQVYKELKSRDYLIDEDESMVTAISKSNIELIKALLEDDYEPDEETIARSFNDLNDTSGIQCLLDSDVEITEDIYEFAYNIGTQPSAPIIWLLHKNGIPWTLFCIRFVVQTNDIEFIKSAISSGCNIPTDILTNQDLYEHEINPVTFQYLIDIGCTCDNNVLQLIVDNSLLGLMPIVCKYTNITMQNIMNVSESGYLDSLEIVVETYVQQRIQQHLSM